MTPDELKKEAEQIHFALNHEPLMDYDGTIIFLLSRLRAVHEAGFNEAREKVAKIAYALDVESVGRLLAGGNMRDIGYRDYADVCDSAASGGYCCRNCYASGLLRNGYCISCLHDLKKCDCDEKTGEDHGE